MLNHTKKKKISLLAPVYHYTRYVTYELNIMSGEEKVCLCLMLFLGEIVQELFILVERLL